MDIARLPGVTIFDHNTAVDEALDNVICTVFGASKSGKTHWSVRCDRPLYVVYADPNTSLDYALLKAEEDGFTGLVYKLVIPPFNGKPFEEFTKEDAQSITDRIETFAESARAAAMEAKA